MYQYVESDAQLIVKWLLKDKVHRGPMLILVMELNAIDQKFIGNITELLNF